jgi:hypothetical protein
MRRRFDPSIFYLLLSTMSVKLWIHLSRAQTFAPKFGKVLSRNQSVEERRVEGSIEGLRAEVIREDQAGECDEEELGAGEN